MSSSKRRGKDDDFIDAGAGGDSSDSGADEPESDVESNESDAGPSTAAGRPKRARRAPGAKRRANETAPKSGTKTIGGKGKGKAWEGTFEHTWDSVREDAQGSLESAVSDLLLSGKNKRVVKDTTSIQRGIIRHVYLVLDLSLAMLVRDFKLPWLDLTLQYAREFVTEFFDQNPISQMAIMVSRDGSVERLSPLSGNPVEHLKALANKKKLEPRGEPSLQNILEMARSGLSHLPPHGSREVIIILGSLTTCDPGNIHATIDATEKDRIRVNIIGLSAEMRICKDICTRTKGTYRVVKEDELSLRELLFEFVSPPPTLASSKTNVLGAASSAGPTNSSDLMLMGFPALVQSPYPGLCSCHSKLKNTGYTCPRCRSRICDVPTECRVCGLTVVSSPHLARSYRHLFPVSNFDQVNGPSDDPYPTSCYSCTFPFKTTLSTVLQVPSTTASSLSPTGRYACKACRNHFCLDCDVLVHTALGFCPGCV